MASKKPTVDPTVSSSDTIVDPAVTVYIQFIDYEEEWWQHTPLSKSNTRGERL